MRPLRIAYLIPVFPELANTFVLNDITGMIDKGHEVDLYPLAVGDYAAAHADVERYGLRERVKHIPIPEDRVARAAGLVRSFLRAEGWHPGVLGALDPRGGRKALSLVPAYTALSFVRQGAYDILHVQFGNLGPAAAQLVARRAPRASLVTSFRGADATKHLPTDPASYQHLFRVGALFLPVSGDLEQRIVGAGAPAARTAVHYSGIDLSRFAFGTRSGGAADPVRLLFVGRLVDKKGVRYALEAFAAAKRSPACAGRDVTFALVGSGPLEPELRAAAAELGVAGDVEFLGSLQQEGVAREMARSQVLLAPSVTAPSGDKEGIPTVIMEAMASGLAVLSTLHGGIPELVEDGTSGFLVEEADVAALAERLETLVAQPELRAAMGAAGRRKVEDDFDDDKLNLELERRYRQLVARKQSGGKPGRT